MPTTKSPAPAYPHQPTTLVVVFVTAVNLLLPVIGWSPQSAHASELPCPIESPECNQPAPGTESIPPFTFSITSPETVNAGETLQYSIHWTRTLAQPTMTTIMSPLPNNTTFLEADGGGIFDHTILTWNLEPVASTVSGTFNVTVRVHSPLVYGSVVTASACWSTSAPIPTCATTTTAVTSAPQLAIEQSISTNDGVNHDHVWSASLTVRNADNASDSARDVFVTVLLPPSLHFSISGGAVKTFQLGTLPPGGALTTTYTVSADSSVPPGTYAVTAATQGSNAPRLTTSTAVVIAAPPALTSQLIDQSSITSSESAVQVLPVSTSQVLGLATTGPSNHYTAIVLLGLSLIGLGVIWYTHLHDRYGHPPA